jgi:hypothetical protein
MKITVPLNKSLIPVNPIGYNAHDAHPRGIETWNDKSKSSHERHVQMLSVMSATRLRFNLISKDNIIWTLHDLHHPDPESYANEIMEFIKHKKYITYP